MPTVFNLANVTDHQVGDGDLQDFTASYRRELVLMFDLALETAELFLFAPVIERRHEYDDDHSSEDRNSLNPSGLRFGLIRRSYSGHQVAVSSLAPHHKVICSIQC